MIVCENCESPRFLNITNSRTDVHDDGDRVTKIKETIECLACALEGTATFDFESDSATITGGLVRTIERPTTATEVEMRGVGQ